jgi:predicted DNA-binding ribbon-helix-helix protein
MARYFFDVVTQNRSEYDSQGTLLCDTNEARKWAQLLAITLRVPNEKQELEDGRVDVRGPDGSELFSIPIRPLEEAFWKGLNGIAAESGLTLSELVADINTGRRHTNLLSAIRLFVLGYYRTKIGAVSGTRGPDVETAQRHKQAPAPHMPLHFHQHAVLSRESHPGPNPRKSNEGA